MDAFPHYFDIVLFAMIAVFLVLRLRSVLGRRTGNERRRDLMGRPPAARGNVVAFGHRAAPQPMPRLNAPPAGGVQDALGQIRAADPGFDPGQFVAGARVAFATVVDAFAAGDKTRLRPLLSDEVFRPFCAAIDERDTAGERLETRIVALKQAEIVEAGLAGRLARVTIKFVSDQIHVLRSRDASVVDGDPERPIEKTDFWTFVRDTRSTDPNWVLVATSSG
ncbi:MAG TPA: Tim44/TimA family putative adaptor protein [Stellaceae bacterium]|nr:Tim44/TimA family putative adaptor protein [Stellaceae bacterium]